MVAVNCCVRPIAREGVSGVTAIEVSVAAKTVTSTEANTPSNNAEILLTPAAFAETRPLVGVELETVAAPELLLDQATDPEMSTTLPSEKVPIAVH